jgi:hypothetical protein
MGAAFIVMGFALWGACWPDVFISLKCVSTCTYQSEVRIDLKYYMGDC